MGSLAVAGGSLLAQQHEASGLGWGPHKESIMGFMLGFYRDDGKENGNYYSIMGFILGLYWGPSCFMAIRGLLA